VTTRAEKIRKLRASRLIELAKGWPSRKVRDQGIKMVMADPRLRPDTNPMPFDGKRMIYGGFEMIVEA
jgi:uncharacterized protein YbaA (DUF1428 family)